MNDHSAPELSVILLTPDRYETVRKTMKYLRAQTVRQLLEIVVVAPSASELELDEEETKGFNGFRVVEVGKMSFSVKAKAAGVYEARSPLVAFVEDHAYPEAGWAEALIRAHREGWTAVGPVVCNANPRGIVSWATYLTAYGRWGEPAVAGEVDDLPGQKGSYRRSALMSYGSELEEMIEVPTILHWDLRARGHGLYWEPSARIHHLHPSLLSSYVQEQFHASRLFAAARAHYGRWSWSRRLLYTARASLIPLVRLWRALRQIHRRGRSRELLPRILPVLFVGTSVEGAGEMVGYALGAGDAPRRIFYFEFHRHRHLTDEDRQAEDRR